MYDLVLYHHGDDRMTDLDRPLAVPVTDEFLIQQIDAGVSYRALIRRYHIGHDRLVRIAGPSTLTSAAGQHTPQQFRDRRARYWAGVTYRSVMQDAITICRRLANLHRPINTIWWRDQRIKAIVAAHRTYMIEKAPFPARKNPTFMVNVERASRDYRSTLMKQLGLVPWDETP